MTASLLDRMDLSGRVALVTGGAGHLGRAVAADLAALGARVVIADCNGAEDAAAALGSGHLGRTVDLEDEAQVIQLVDGLERLDIIVAAAAFVGTSGLEGWAVPFARQSVATWRRAMEVNLTSVFSLIQKAAPLLETSGKGSVVLVSSIYGGLGPQWALYEGTSLGNPAAYAASKGGLEQLCRWLATTLAPKVRVNAIRLGGIERGQDAQFIERYCERTPLGRMAREEDVTGAVAYLASDVSAYVTGTVLAVDGGWSAW
ncbi:MAG: SDR family oxidoreductase [Rhodospirillales bacterium]